MKKTIGVRSLTIELRLFMLRLVDFQDHFQYNNRFRIGMAINSSGLEINPKDTRTIQSIAKEYIEWFPSELYTCDFVNWAEEYIHLFVLNGTHWSIRIEYDTHCEIKTGNTLSTQMDKIL